MGQLKMIFDAAHTALPELSVPEEFLLRSVQDAELAEYNELRVSAGFTAWDEADLAKYRRSVLPDAMYLLTEKTTGRFAASAGAENSATPNHPEFGNLGWVMVRPDLRGAHLGSVVCAAAMRRLHRAGFRTFALSTDDCRKPAVKTYLKLGWRPWMINADMHGRWQALSGELGFDLASLQTFAADQTFPARGAEN